MRKKKLIPKRRCVQALVGWLARVVVIALSLRCIVVVVVIYRCFLVRCFALLCCCASVSLSASQQTGRPLLPASKVRHLSAWVLIRQVPLRP